MVEHVGVRDTTCWAVLCSSKWWEVPDPSPFWNSLGISLYLSSLEIFCPISSIFLKSSCTDFRRRLPTPSPHLFLLPLVPSPCLPLPEHCLLIRCNFKPTLSESLLLYRCFWYLTYSLSSCVIDQVLHRLSQVYELWYHCNIPNWEQTVIQSIQRLNLQQTEIHIKNTMNWAKTAEPFY